MNDFIVLEMVTLFPLDGSFLRLVTRFVDPAAGVAIGWNYFVRTVLRMNIEFG